jgi:hypothetical protein
MKTTSSASKKATVSVLMILVTVFATVSPAWAHVWATVGSAGTVDAADANIVSYDRGVVMIASNAPLPASLTMRYNVLLPPLPNPVSVNLAVRYLDNGGQAHVVVRLRQYNMATGAYLTVATFDSDKFPVGSGTQLRDDQCSVPLNLDPHQFGYWIEAEVTKSTAAGDARLGIVHIQQCGTFPL